MANNINTLTAGSGTVKSGTSVWTKTGEENYSTKSLNKAASAVSGMTSVVNTKASEQSLNRAASLMGGVNRTANAQVYSTQSTEESDTAAPDEDFYTQFLNTVAPYVKMTDEEKRYFYNISGIMKKNNADVKEWAEDFLSTNAMANALGVSRSEINSNRSYMLKEYLGIEEDKPFTFTWAASIINSYKQGRRQQDMAQQQKELLDLYKKGYDDDSYMVKNKAQDVLQLEQEMSYYQDSTERTGFGGALTEWIQNSIQQIPYMLDGTLSGIVGAIIGGSIAGPTGAKIGNYAMRYLSYSDQFEASAFWNMKQAGISTENALKYSKLDGFFNGLNEAFLDVISGAFMGTLGKATGFNISNSLISSILNKAAKSGSLGSFIGRFLLYMGLDSSGEFIQEGSESLTSAFFESLAEIADGNENVEYISREDWKNAWDEGVQGFLNGLFFGIPGATVNVLVDIPKATKLKNTSIHTPSEESFVNNPQNRNLLQSFKTGGADLTEEQTTNLLTGLYESTQSVREDLKNNIRKDIFEQLKTIDGTLDESVLNNMVITDREIRNEKGEVVSGKGTAVKTKDDGSLYFVIDKETASDDGKSTTYTMRIANPDVVGASALGEFYVNAKVADVDNDPQYQSTKAINSIKDAPSALAMEQAGKITFTVNEENGSLTIDSVQVQDDSSSLKKQAVQELSAMYPEYNISWENQTESDKAVFEDIEKANPRNTSKETYGLNYNEKLSADDTDTAYVKRWLGNKFSEDTSENNFMATILQAAAKARGLSGKEFIEKYLNDIQDVTDADLKDNPNVKGYTKMTRDDITKQVKATIYAGKNADPTTFLHELHHTIMLMEDNMKEFSDIYQKVKGTKQFKAFLEKNRDIILNSDTVRKAIVQVDKDGKYIRDAKGVCLIDDSKLETMFKSGDKWTEAEFELEARIYEAYLRSGQTFNPTLTGFFRRVAETFRQIYRAMRNGFASVQLNDEVVEYFDKLYGYDKQTGKTSSLSGKGELYTISEKMEGGTQSETLKQEDEYSPEKYQKIRQNILDNYSDTSLYTKTDTSSENVYVFGEYYDDYLNKRISKRQQGVLEKEIKAGEVFGKLGYQVYILPEQIFIADKKYEGNIADAILNGALLEFKKLESNTYGSLQRNLAEGLKKSDIVYVELTDAKLPSKSGVFGPKRAIEGELNKYTDDRSSKIVIYSVNGEKPMAYLEKNGLHTWMPLGEAGLSTRFNNNIASSDDSVKDVLKQEQSPAEQYEAVKAQYYGTDKYMIAPDGAASNLTEDQWIQVRTPNFLSWGGDWINDPEHAAVILDENGEPKQLYHGSPSTGIEVFNNDRRSINGGEQGLTYLTDTEDVADRFSREFEEGSSAYTVRLTGRAGEVYPLFAKMSNPLDFRSLTEQNKNDIAETYVDDVFGADAKDRASQIEQTKSSIENALRHENYQLIKGYAKSYLDNLESYGYDGIIAPMGTQRSEEIYRDALEYAVSSANQVKSATDNSGEFALDEDSILMQEVTDEQLLKELEEGETIKVYRSMQLIDGGLYPPMAEVVEGKRQSVTEIGKWYKSDERPDLAFEQVKGSGQWFFKLIKYYENGKSSLVPARYNPYFHTTSSPLNDQFLAAYRRPNLVVVEVEIPKSELTSGYKADKAKDSVGEMNWHSGSVSGALAKLTGKHRSVILTRYNKVVRILDNSEVAGYIAEQLRGTDIKIPENVVSPGLYTELKKLGVEFKERSDVQRYRAEQQKTKDVLMQFIGEVGASNVEELPDAMNKRVIAEQMEEAGKNEREIWAATGWFRGTDTKWRMEIPDTVRNLDYTTEEEFKKHYSYDTTYSLSDFIDERLVKLYPSLNDIAVVFYNENTKSGGRYIGANKTLEVNTAYFDKIKPTIVHETQHAIQSIEGFATGASPRWMLNLAMKRAEESLSEYTKAGKILSPYKNFSRPLENYITWQKALENPDENVRNTRIFYDYGDFDEPANEEEAHQQNLAAIKKAKAFYTSETKELRKQLSSNNLEEGLIPSYMATTDLKKIPLEELSNLLEKVNDKISSLTEETEFLKKAAEFSKYAGLRNGDYVNNYLRLSGEVEARNAEQRYSDNSYGTFPLETEDVSRENQLVMSQNRADVFTSEELSLKQEDESSKSTIGNYFVLKTDEGEINSLIDDIISKADSLADSKKFSEENWKAEFDGYVFHTTIGDVKLGEHQYQKLIAKKRTKDWAMIKPTLDSPSLILSEYEDGEETGCYNFIKVFNTGDGKKWFYSAVITKDREGLFSISNRRTDERQVKNKLKKTLRVYSAAESTAERGSVQNSQLTSVLNNNIVDNDEVVKNKSDLEALQTASQQNLEEMAISGESLKQVGDDEWTETAKRIALEAPSLEDFFRLYRERIESGDLELSDSNTALLLSDIYDESKQSNYEDFDESYFDSIESEDEVDEDDFWKVEDEEPSESAASASDSSEEVPDWFDLDEKETSESQTQEAAHAAENIEEDEDDFWKVEDDDESSSATAATASSTEMPNDVPDWFDLDGAEEEAQTTEQSIKEVEAAVTEIQKVVVDSDLPSKLSLDHSRSLDTSLKARAVEFASILRESKEETIRFLETLKRVNAEFFYQNSEASGEITSEEEYQAQAMRQSAFEDFGNISKFIQNLIFDSRGASVSRNLNNLSDRAWKIVAGQVAKNAEVYMDLYARAANNAEWSGDASIEAQVLQELGVSAEEWNKLSYYKRKMYMQDIADKELREKIMSGKVYDADLRGWIKRAEAKAEASLAEAKAIEESQNFIISEDKKTILRLSTGAKDAQKKIADLQTEQEEVQERIDKLVIRMENKLKRNNTPTQEETLLHSELKKRQNQLKKRQTQYENALKAWQNKNLKKADTKALTAELDRVRQLYKEAQDRVTELLNKNDLTPEEALERLENLYSTWQDTKLKDAIDKVKDHYKDRLEQAAKDRKDALKKQEKKISDIYKQKLKDATKNKNDALKKAHKAYMQEMRQRDALRRVRQEKERLARQIMKAPSSNVALEEAQQIKAIQALIDPAYRRSTMKTIDGVKYTVEELKRILNSNPQDPVLQKLTQRQLERLTKVSLDEMSMAEVETTYQYILKLREDGLNKRRSEILQRKTENQVILSSLMTTLRANPKFTEYGFEGTEDKKNRQNTKKNKIRDAWYQTLNMARKAQTLDNGEKGVFYDLLIRKKRLLQSEEMKNVMARSKKIEDVIKNNKIDKDSLYKTWTVKLENGRNVTFTTSELGYIYLSQNCEDNRDAVAYGTLVNTEERMNIIAAAEKAIVGTGKNLIDARNNKIDADIRALGDWRYNAVLKLATEVIEKDKGMLTLVKAIEADFNDPSFDRVINLVRKLYNVEVKKQRYYLPINRTDFLGKEPGEDIKNDLLNQVPGTKGNVQKGFTKDRIVIAPRNQKAVKYDLFKVWTTAVKNQEHFLAMQEYVNQLNSIFVTSNTKTNTLRANIENTYGKEMLDAIDTHIKEIADPNAGAVQSDPARDILKAAKGNIYSAYLGFKLSSITNQLITSPAAFFGKVGPLRYAKNLLQMTLPASFKKTSEEVFRLSPFMKSRNFDIIAGEIKEAAEAVGMPKYKKAWANFLDFGLKGLEWVDQYTVVAGWKSIYEQELEKLGDATNADNIRRAVQIADEYVQETQPQSDKTEIAPLYKNKNEMLNILLQFQSSLNVVWNNLAYDTVNNFRKKDLRTAIGTVFGYAAAGALLSLAHGDFQPDDDDEDYSFWRTFYYSITSQGIESIPVFSSYIDSIFGYVVNNEKPSYNTTSITPFPMLAEAFNAGKYTVQSIKERNTEYLGKAMEKGANAFMLATGLPYSGIRELKAIQDRGVQALIGAR